MTQTTDTSSMQKKDDSAIDWHTIDLIARAKSIKDKLNRGILSIGNIDQYLYRVMQSGLQAEQEMLNPTAEESKLILKRDLKLIELKTKYYIGE